MGDNNNATGDIQPIEQPNNIENVNTRIKEKAIDTTKPTYVWSSAVSENSNTGIPELNISLLTQLELEANRIVTSIDDLTENLTGILRSISALTLEAVECYRRAICKTCDSIDSNIKLMYQLIAKCEEVGRVAKPLSTLSQYVKDIKHVLDLLESASNA